MSDNGIEGLAAKLNRPPRSLAAFRELAPEKIAQLERWVDQALARDNALVEAAFRDAVPWLLRGLVRRVLRV